MKKERVIAIIFFALLILPSLIYPAVKSCVDVDLHENRNLNALGSDLAGFGTSFDAYFSDRIPFRSNLVSLYNALVARLARDGTVTTDPWRVHGKDGWLFTKDDNSESYYEATNLLSQSELDEYATVVRRASSLLAERGILFLVEVHPNKEQIYPEYYPDTYYVRTDYKRTDRLVDYLRANTAVPILYGKPQLIYAKPQYQSYLKYDTHHNMLGAYTDYRLLASALNIATPDLSTLNVTSFLWRGDLLSGDTIPTDSIDYKIDYRPEAEVLSRTDLDVRGNLEYWRLVSSAQNAKTVFYMGDSFRTRACNNFIIKDYQTVISMHGRRLNHPDLYAEIKECLAQSDVFIYECVERRDSEMLPLLQKLVDMLTI